MGSFKPRRKTPIRTVFICPKNSDHIMPYRPPYVFFSERAKIFFVVLLASHNPKTTIKKNVCMSVCLSVCMSVCLSVCLSVPSTVCAGFEVFLVVRLPSTSICDLFERFPRGVFHPISVLTPPLPPPPSKKWQFLKKVCAGF